MSSGAPPAAARSIMTLESELLLYYGRGKHGADHHQALYRTGGAGVEGSRAGGGVLRTQRHPGGWAQGFRDSPAAEGGMHPPPRDSAVRFQPRYGGRCAERGPGKVPVQGNKVRPEPYRKYPPLSAARHAAAIVLDISKNGAGGGLLEVAAVEKGRITSLHERVLDREILSGTFYISSATFRYGLDSR